MAALHIEQGFDLKHVRNYASAVNAAKAVQMELASLIAVGVVFNVTVVEQTKEGRQISGMAAPLTTRRFVPILYAFRAPTNFAGGDTQAAIIASRAGFVSFN